MNIRDRMQRIADDMGLDLYDPVTKTVVCAFAWQECADELKTEVCELQIKVDALERRRAEERDR